MNPFNLYLTNKIHMSKWRFPNLMPPGKNKN